MPAGQQSSDTPICPREPARFSRKKRSLNVGMKYSGASPKWMLSAVWLPGKDLS